MHQDQSIVEIPLAAQMDELVERFGLWRAAGAVVFAAWRKRQKYNSISALSPHMRADLGLPEERPLYPSQLPPSRFSIWDIRF